MRWCGLPLKWPGACWICRRKKPEINLQGVEVFVGADSSAKTVVQALQMQ
jgi:hypothetical protein